MSKGYFRLIGRIGDNPEKFEEVDVIAKQLPFTLGAILFLRAHCYTLIPIVFFSTNREEPVDRQSFVSRFGK